MAFAERKLPFISFYSFILVYICIVCFVCILYVSSARRMRAPPKMRSRKFRSADGKSRAAAGQVQHTSVDRRHASAVDDPAVNVITENGKLGARFCITERTQSYAVQFPYRQRALVLRRVPAAYPSVFAVAAHRTVRLSLILRPAPFGDLRFSPPHPRELRE